MDAGVRDIFGSLLVDSEDGNGFILRVEPSRYRRMRMRFARG
jgi:hypothetical protein